MTSDREFIANTEKASPEGFANILRTTNGAAERVLRTHFTDAAFERMQALAKTTAVAPTGTVVLLPGILGSELHEGGETIWMDIRSIIKGDFDQLQVNLKGLSAS